MVIGSSHTCEHCGKPRETGKTYSFHYGWKSGESRHYEGAMRVRSQYYRFAGEQGAWLCDRCMRPRKWLNAALWGFFPALLVISPLLGLWEDVLSNVCYAGLGLGLLGYLVWFMRKYPDESGEKLAIRLHKKSLKAQGHNCFLTHYSYNAIKKQAS